jgi:hypothetical protein
MYKMKNYAVILLFVIFISGCASVSFVPHGAINYQPKSNDYVMPIISINGPQPIDGTYIILGNVEAVKDAVTVFDKVNLSDVTEMIKQAAREKGADALIKVQYWHGRSSGRRVDSIRVNATAIVFKDSSEAFKQLKEMGAVFK